MSFNNRDIDLIKAYAKLPERGNISKSIEGLAKLLLSLVQYENSYTGLTFGNIEEEIADGEIIIAILKTIFDGNVINQAKERKLEVIKKTVNQLKRRGLD